MLSAILEEAMVLTPEFHTLGAPKPQGIRPAETQTGTGRAEPRSYKAGKQIFYNLRVLVLRTDVD